MITAEQHKIIHIMCPPEKAEELLNNPDMEYFLNTQRYFSRDSLQKSLRDPDEVTYAIIFRFTREGGIWWYHQYKKESIELWRTRVRNRIQQVLYKLDNPVIDLSKHL